MPELDDDGTANEQPADDIRSSLAAALAESESAATSDTAAPVAGEAEPKSDAGAAPAAGERVRGPDGKFLKKEDGDAATAKPAAPDPKAAPAADPATQPAVDTREPPTHWAQADKDKFKAQAPEAQAFILDRFKAMEGDYTRKTQEVAHLKKEYGPVEDMFAPHREVMRQKGFSPRSLIEAWANVETKLANGPDSAIDVIKGLVGGYNIPVAKLAAALGISSTQAPAPAADQQQPGQQQQPTAIENGQEVPVSPAVAAELRALREQVGQFGQKFQTIEQRDAAIRAAQEREQEAAVQKQVNEFKSAQDDKGNLQHPHFEEVESHMTLMAQGYVASKQAVPALKDLYEMAVYANPSVREKVLTAKGQQEEAARTEAAKAKAAAARRAGSSVTGAPGSGQAPAGKQTEQSIRGSLEAAYDDVVS